MTYLLPPVVKHSIAERVTTNYLQVTVASNIPLKKSYCPQLDLTSHNLPPSKVWRDTSKKKFIL